MAGRGTVADPNASGDVALRARPWVWGLAMVGFFSGLEWVGDPIGDSAVSVDPLSQLARIATFALPATALVGVLYAFVPPRHLVLRTALLLFIGLYVSATGTLFTFRALAAACGAAACGTTTVSRIVGIGGQVGALVAGFAVEEVVRLVRRRRP